MNPIKSHPYKPVNPSGEALCAEKLRTFSGFENCPDDEANVIVETIKALAGILVRSVNKYSHATRRRAIRLEPSLKTRKAA